MEKISKQDIKKLANTIRVLSVDAINQAKSGHVGTPLGSADVVATLFANFLKFNPKKPTWCNRDRFILSAGHSCAMLYSTLHLLGYEKFNMETIKNLRQITSIASGHPEKEHEAGIEVTTGPLGEGVAMAVGIAIGERILNAKYEKIINHLTYALVGDGCLMEGVSYEALSLAGSLGLNKLVVIYDKNNITIDGALNLSNSEDISKRMESLGFNVLEINGHDLNQIDEVLNKVQNLAKNSKKPTFIISNTIIGYGIPSKENTAAAHGFALNAEDIATLKKNLSLETLPFEITEEVKSISNSIIQSKIELFKNWEERLNANPNKNNFLEFTNLDFKAIYKNAEVMKDLNILATEYIEKKPLLATRVASGKVLEILCKHVPNFIGGSADLSSSNNTINKYSLAFNSKNSNGNYIHYGVREHAMGAIMNGIACYENGLLPYGGTFLAFSDFMRPAIRLSAIMEVPVIYIFTHDNISLGGDGPTHQPIEHIDSLKLIPNLEVIRPCDLIETIESYEIALENNKTPTALILGRENIPALRESYNSSENKVKKGGYILVNNKNATVNLISAGSELHLALEVNKLLLEKGVISKVISMPSLNRFANQSNEYQKEVIGDCNLNVVIEAKRISGYKDVIGSNTLYIGMNSFGKSGESKDLLDYFGFTKEKISKIILEKLPLFK